MKHERFERLARESAALLAWATQPQVQEETQDLISVECRVQDDILACIECDYQDGLLTPGEAWLRYHGRSI